MFGQVQRLEVENFRSIRHVEVSLGAVNLVTGANGCGKSNLFNAFRLIRAAVEGRLAAAVAEQGGLASLLWAGPRQEGPVRMRLKVAADPFEYEVTLGLRPASELPLFPLDPQIKSETVRLAGRVLVDRSSSVAKMRGLEGPWNLRTDLVDAESVFAQIRDPERYPFLFQFQELVRRWTFYHDFRTDDSSPIRRPALATYAPRLAEDGSNLGPALFVVTEQGDNDSLRSILAGAFPETEFLSEREQPFMVLPGIDRKFHPRDFSDGTLKFLCLVTACFSPRPSPLIAFNEPEASLNASVLEPLADAFAHASQFSQLWITTHSDILARAIVNRVGCDPIHLVKVSGETTLDGRLHRKGWQSPAD